MRSKSRSTRLWNPPARDVTPVRFRLKQPDLRVRSKRITDMDGDVMTAVLTAYDLDFNGPQEPTRPTMPTKFEDHCVEVFRDDPEYRGHPAYVETYGVTMAPRVRLIAWIAYDPSEGPFVIDNDTQTGIAPNDADEIRQWLEGEIAAMEPTARIEPTPGRLQGVRDQLALYGFELVEHHWAGANLFEVHYPAGSVPWVCGHYNPMNIEDVERFLHGYAPCREQWHNVYGRLKKG